MSGGHRRRSNAMTTDAEVEYTIDVPGQYLAVDLNTLDACWGDVQSMDSKTAAADVWIYLTPSPDVVFVDLVVVEGVGSNAAEATCICHTADAGLEAGRLVWLWHFTRHVLS